MAVEVTIVLFVVFLIAVIITAIFVPVSIKLAHKVGAIDIPKDDRRVHTKPVPRIGGVGIFVGVILTGFLMVLTGMFIQGNFNRLHGVCFVNLGFFYKDSSGLASGLGVLMGSIVIFAFGLVDDIRNLSPKVKLIGQILAATIAFLFGVQIDFVNIFFGGTHFSGVLCYLVTVLWIVAITNTINLVDGLDGLAAGVTAIASLCIAYIGYIFGYYMGTIPMILIAGVSIGFLLYNFYPAKTFMGDCGSQFLGYLLPCFSILGSVKSATFVAVIIPGLALSLPIFDTAFAIVRRVINGRPVMEADKEHIHHRLLKSGMGQRRTVLIIYGICGIMGVAAVLISRELFVESFGLILVAVLYIYIVLTDKKRKVPKIKGK